MDGFVDFYLDFCLGVLMWLWLLCFGGGLLMCLFDLGWCVVVPITVLGLLVLFVVCGLVFNVIFGCLWIICTLWCLVGECASCVCFCRSFWFCLDVCFVDLYLFLFGFVLVVFILVGWYSLVSWLLRLGLWFWFLILMIVVWFAGCFSVMGLLICCFVLLDL